MFMALHLQSLDCICWPKRSHISR